MVIISLVFLVFLALQATKCRAYPYLNVWYCGSKCQDSVCRQVKNNSRPTMYVNRYGRILFQLLIDVLYFIIVEITVSV